MSNLHRKTLKITTQKFGYTVLDGADVHPPSPPPPPPLEIHSISPLKVFMICSLAATFSFVCYIAIIKTCRAFRNRSRTRSSSHGNRNETHQDFIDEDHESVVFHPIWLINTIGLNQSVIDSIQIIKYRKKDGLIGGTDSGSDCAICLGEFQDEESLRILPKCSHAFHVTCIDTWLRSHKNCPVCRAPVVNNTSIHQVDRNTTESSPQEDIPIGVFENETLLLENAKQIDTSGESSENKSLFNGDRVQSDLTDHRHQKVELIRRSVSMDMADFVDRGSRELMGAKKPNILQKSTKGRGSSSSISIYSRARKSSSFGRS